MASMLGGSSVLAGKFGYPVRDPTEVGRFVAAHDSYRKAAANPEAMRLAMGRASNNKVPLADFDDLLAAVAEQKRICSRFDAKLVHLRTPLVDALALAGFDEAEAAALAGPAVREPEFAKTMAHQHDELEREIHETALEIERSAKKHEKRSKLWHGDKRIKDAIAEKEARVKALEESMARGEWAGEERWEGIVNGLRAKNQAIMLKKSQFKYLVKQKAELQQYLVNQSAQMSAMGAWLNKDNLLKAEVDRVSKLLDQTERKEQSKVLDFNRRMDLALQPKFTDLLSNVVGGKRKFVTDPFWAADTNSPTMRCADEIVALRPDVGSSDVHDTDFENRQTVLISFGDKRALRPRWLPGPASESEAMKYALRPLKLSFQVKVTSEVGVRMVRMKPERRVGDLLPWTQQLEPLNLESNAEVTETFFTADTVVQYLCLTKTLEGGAEEAVSPVVKEVLHDDGKKYKVTFYKCANFDGWVHDFDRKSPGASKTIEVLDADRELPRVVDGNAVFFNNTPTISHVGDSAKMELFRKYFIDRLVENSPEVDLRSTLEDETSGMHCDDVKRFFDEHRDLQHRSEDYFGVAADETWLREREVYENMQRRVEEEAMRLHETKQLPAGGVAGGAVTSGAAEDEGEAGAAPTALPATCLHLETHDCWLGSALPSFQKMKRGRYALYTVRKKTKKSRDQKILWMGILLLRETDVQYIYDEMELTCFQDLKWGDPIDYSMASYVSVEQQRLLADVFLRNDVDRLGIGRGFLTDKQLSNALRAETPQGLGIEWIIGMEEQYKAFDKNSDSVFDYLEFQQIAAHFTIEQTKTMAGASQLLLTDGRRDFMKETNKRKLRKMFDRFDLDGSGGLDKKEIISILNELTESRGKPLDKTTIISLFEEYDADGSGGLDFDEFLDLATDLFLLEEHRQSVELSSPFAAPAASVPPAKKDKEKMVLYFGRSEDFPMVDFSGLGKIVPDGVIDGMSIIDEDHIVGGAPFNGLNCTGMSYRLEMARMLFVKCFARVDKIQNRISDDHLFDWGSKSFADGKDDSKEVDFDQVFDCSDVVVDEKAMERYEKLYSECDKIRKLRQELEVAFADAVQAADDLASPANLKAKNEAGAELDKILKQQDAKNKEYARAKDPWVLRYATLHDFTADQAASFRKRLMDEARAKTEGERMEFDIPEWDEAVVQVVALQERGPEGDHDGGQLWYTVKIGVGARAKGSKAEFEKSSVELADINRHNLRKGAWHESNFRTIVRDTLAQQEEAKRRRQRFPDSKYTRLLEGHQPAFNAVAYDLRHIDIEDIAVDAFGWQAVPTADDAKHIDDFDSRTTGEPEYGIFSHFADRSPRRHLRFEVICARNDGAMEVQDQGKKCKWGDGCIRYMLIVLHNKTDIDHMTKVVEESAKISAEEGSYQKYHPYNFDGDETVQNVSIDMKSSKVPGMQARRRRRAKH